MKDRDARNAVAILHMKVNTQEECIARLESRLKDITTAFNELFDIVAPDLGFEAAREPSVYAPAFMWTKLSPRRAGKTSPQPEVIRTGTRKRIK